jgi:hypothetical protein
VNRGRLLIVLPYLVLTWFFGGWYGLLAGALIVTLWVSLGPYGRALWALAVLLLLAAAVATILQGPPSVAGGVTTHMAAHVLVALALATAGLAAFAEVGRERAVQGPDLGDGEGSDRTTTSTQADGSAAS